MRYKTDMGVVIFRFLKLSFKLFLVTSFFYPCILFFFYFCNCNYSKTARDLNLLHQHVFENAFGIMTSEANVLPFVYNGLILTDPLQGEKERQ